MITDAELKTLIGKRVTLRQGNTTVTITVTGVDIERGWGAYLTTTSGKAFRLDTVQVMTVG